MSITQTSRRSLADRLGIWASAACVVHCLLTPVLLSASAVFAHFLPSEEPVHRSMAVLVAGFGTVALIHGFRTHRRRRVIALMLAGFTLIAMGAFWGNHLPAHAYEVGITMLGSALMITAHRMNHTFCRSCSCADEGSSLRG